MILVTAGTSTNTKIYNPMLASVSYTNSGSDNTTAGGTVDANSNWTLDGEVVYAKSSDPAPQKVILNPDSQNAKGDDVAVGDTVQFQITAKIPSYNGEAYENPVFKLTDTLSTGLTLEGTPAVAISEGQITENTDYTLTINGQTLTVELKPAYIMANGLKTITITYGAKVNDKAAINAGFNNNDVVLTYSNSPTTTATADDKVYVYTFGLGASLKGTMDDTVGQTTHEIVKVAAETYAKYDTYEKWVEAGMPGALGGATFKLTSNADSSVSYTQLSDKVGALAFKGLDAGEYTLVETEAPEGYSVDNTVHTVVITPTYREDGLLESYTVVIDGKATSTYTMSYKGTGTHIELDDVTVTKTGETSFVTNTKLAQLPSTGGMGTYLFTIIGVAVMAAAAGLFLARRRRQA